MFFPEDFVIAEAIKDGLPTKNVGEDSGIPDGWCGIDIGEKSRQRFSDVIGGSKTIFLNGPSGVFEFGIAKAGSISVVEVIKHIILRLSLEQQRITVQLYVVEEIQFLVLI